MLQFLTVLTVSFAAYINFDSGTSNTFDQDACTPDSQRGETVAFAGTFQNIPQMFVYSNYFSIEYNNIGQFIQVEILPLVITQTNFQITVSCVGNRTKDTTINGMHLQIQE